MAVCGRGLAELGPEPLLLPSLVLFAFLLRSRGVIAVDARAARSDLNCVRSLKPAQYGVGPKTG
jgi:hypothetical protein